MSVEGAIFAELLLEHPPRPVRGRDGAPAGFEADAAVAAALDAGLPGALARTWGVAAVAGALRALAEEG
jgi:hypothetical protein